jgi:hypothetical protein
VLCHELVNFNSSPINEASKKKRGFIEFLKSGCLLFYSLNRADFRMDVKNKLWYGFSGVISPFSATLKQVLSIRRENIEAKSILLLFLLELPFSVI